jgi:hypothetical protein
MKMIGEELRRTRALAQIGAIVLAIWSNSAIASACRITDYTDKPLSALNGAERLSFLSELTPTEFQKIKAAAPGDPNYSQIVARSDTAAAVRNTARDQLISQKIDNVEGYRQIWATDFLSDEQMRHFADCVSGRYPGLTVMGRAVDPSHFNLTYVHVTPIGIEKITTRILASGNVANVKELEESLAELGPQDNYTARTFTVVRDDPRKPAIIVMRAGWETPKIVYIPVYPTPDFLR